MTEKRIVVFFFLLGGIAITFAYKLVTQFSYPLFYSSIAYGAVVMTSLYLNTVIKRK
jgi:hypothetical protein